MRGRLGVLAALAMLGAGCPHIKAQIRDPQGGGFWVIRERFLRSDEISYCTAPPMVCLVAEKD